MTTIGEAYGPAMTINDQADADAYFEKLVSSRMANSGVSRDKAEEIERSNLGYYAGYYSAETRERVERLFICKHPIFGAIADLGQPTPEEAFQAGMNMARKD
jgi:hypothetical protein